MSNSKNVWLQLGWMRALLFFAVFLVVYVAGNLLLLQSNLDQVFTVEYLNLLLFVVALLIVLLPFRWYIDKRSIYSLGFSGDTPGAWRGLLAAILILGSGTLVLWLNGNLRLEYRGFNFTDLIRSAIFMAVVALSEELLFRGYILNNLLQSFSKWIALGISAAMFAFMHTGNPNVTAIAVINVFLAGLLLGANYIYSGKLWFAIVFHFAWNFLQGPLLGYNVSGVNIRGVLKATLDGPSYLTGGEFGFEGSVLQTVGMALALITILFRKRRFGSGNAHPAQR